MKAVAFLNTMRSWGGGEKWHFYSAVYFAQKGYDVHFFLERNSELHHKLQPFTGITLHFVKYNGLSFLNPWEVKKLKRKLQHIRPHVLLINLSRDLKIGGRAAMEAKVARVIYRRAIPVPVADSFLNRYIFSNWLTDVLANSLATKKAILQENPALIEERKIKVIYNPIRFAEDNPKRKPAKIYEKKNGELVIGSLGRLEVEKNHRYLIRLSTRLKSRNINHRVLIAGSGSLRKDLEEYARQLGVSEHVVFVGFLEDVKQLFYSIDVFVFPSLWEGFGFAVAEASACGLPVIAFDTTSIPEVVEDGITGFIIDVDSVEQGAEKLILLSKDEKLRSHMGQQGREFIWHKFDYDKIMPQLEDFLFPAAK